jgi:hypothetical protein
MSDFDETVTTMINQKIEQMRIAQNILFSS